MLQKSVEWSYSPRQLAVALQHAKKIRDNLDRVALIGRVAEARAMELEQRERSREEELELLGLGEIALAAEAHLDRDYNASRCALRRLRGLLDRWEERGELPGDVPEPEPDIEEEEDPLPPSLSPRSAARRPPLRPPVVRRPPPRPAIFAELLKRHQGALGWFLRRRVLERWSAEDRADAAEFFELVTTDVVTTLGRLDDRELQRLAEDVGEMARQVLVELLQPAASAQPQGQA